MSMVNLNGRELNYQGNNADTPAPVLATTAEREILTWAEEQLNLCRRERMRFEQQWYINLAYYFGRQYVQWSGLYETPNGMYARLVEPASPPWRVRLITNKVRRFIRKEHAQITKENPEPYVIPASSDDDDVAAARAGERIYEHLWRELKGRSKVRQMALWMCYTGTGFLKDWFDPSDTDESGQQGVIRLDVPTPYHIYVPELDEVEIDAQPYLFQLMSKTPDWVEERYGIKLAADSRNSGGVLEQKFLQAMGLDTAGGLDRVAVREMWVKPCLRFPKGALVIYAQEHVLDVVNGFPYGTRDYCHTKFSHIPTGRFYGESIITDLIPLQKEYNRTRSQIIEAKNRMAKPQMVAPRGSIDANKITSEPGLVIFYTPGFDKPQQLKLEPLPQYVLEDVVRCDADMQDIASQHEVSKGSAPPGVSAATAISYLQEQDDTVLSETITSIEEGVARIGKHLLIHVNTFWVLPRTVKVVGFDREYESYLLSQADVAGNTDLNIQTGSAMPRSRAAKQAFILQLGQMGWLTPDKALRYLDMAETGRMYEELMKDTRQAQRENIKMMMGTEVPVNSWDEHIIHIMSHNDERKTQRFENSPDQVKMIYERHVQMHQMAMQANMARMQMMGGEIPGMSGQPQLGPGGKPTGPPPGSSRPAVQPVVMNPLKPMQSSGGMGAPGGQ